MYYPFAKSDHYPKFDFKNIDNLKFYAAIRKDIHRLTDGLPEEKRYELLRYLFATHYDILDKMLTTGQVSHERLAFIAMDMFLKGYLATSRVGSALDRYESLCLELVQLTKLIEAERDGMTSYESVFIEDEDLLEDE